MSQERGFDMGPTPEIAEKVTVTYLGRLKDLGLGNPEGIPSKLADASREELELFGERLLESSKPVSDFEHDGCLDGRCVLCNADKSEPEVRERHVSGTASDTEIAMNAGSPVLDTLRADASLADTIDAVTKYVQQRSGKKRAAHTEGCGGANGAIVHNELIGNDPAPLDATKALLEIPAVVDRTGVKYDETLADEVRQQAPKTAAWLRTNGWNGQTYVDKTAKHEPSGVEELQGGDDALRGHAEDALVIDLREGVVVTLDNVFVASISAIIKKAQALGGENGDEGYTKALIADIAKHMAVAKVLPSEDTPVFLIG